MSHPTRATASAAELAAWANCSVPDCDAKVTHNSDRCYPHTHGWAATRENYLRTLEGFRQQPPSPRRDELIAIWTAEFEKIKYRR
jgi:hypothetical protein